MAQLTRGGDFPQPKSGLCDHLFSNWPRRPAWKDTVEEVLAPATFMSSLQGSRLIYSNVENLTTPNFLVFFSGGLMDCDLRLTVSSVLAACGPQELAPNWEILSRPLTIPHPSPTRVFHFVTSRTGSYRASLILTLMSFVARLVQKLFGPSSRSDIAAKSAVSSQTPCTLRDFARFAAGDRVLINGKRLSNPLRPGGSNSVPQSNGQLRHDDVLGQPLGPLKINGSDGRHVKVEQPTLDQYVSLTRRNVTPIYAAYASTIVSLLDLHPPTPGPSTARSPPPPRLEILEAGTGHGSLTIHLGRAIAAANQPPPLSPLPHGRQTDTATGAKDPEWSQWLKDRRAVVNTVEKVPKNSQDAEKLIREFRQGLYWPHIDFYAGGVDTWLQERLQAERAAGFLSHVILDMPGVEEMLPLAAKAMHEGATMAVFCPSITQIAECQRLIKQESVPLVHDKAVELGEGISTGRVWDVRVVTPRRALADATAAATPAGDENTSEPGSELESDAEAPSTTSEGAAHTGPLKFVCRPKVGERTFGGGFLGLWRKSSAK